MIYRMKLADSVDEMTFDLLEVPIEDKDIEGATDNTTIDGNIFTDYLWLKKQFVQKWSLMCKDDYTQLRGFYTRQWENAEAPTYTLFAGQNRSETLTASGSAFRIQNGTQYDAPLTLTELKGNATQNGTPTPDAPQAVNTTTGENVVKITGKNLWNATVENGGLDASGNSFTSTTQLRTIGYIEVEPNTEYTFSNTNGLVVDRICYYNGGKTFIERGGYLNVGTFTTPNNGCQYARFVIRATDGSGITPSSLVSPQLELGSTATTYEPYQGQELEVNLGKNLIEPKMPTTTFKGITCTNNGDGSFTLNGTATGGADFRINQSARTGSDNLQNYDGTYTLSCEGISSGVQVIVMQDQTWVKKLQIDSGSTPATASFTANDCFVYVNVLSGTALNNLTIRPQLEAGSTATAYAPYFTPIELAKIGNYQDRIYKLGDNWFVRKEIGKAVVDGSVGTISMPSANRFNIDNAIIDYNKTNNAVLAISDRYEVLKQTYDNASFNSVASSKNYAMNFGSGAPYNLRFKNTDFTTIEGFEAELASNPTTVYYALATPTTTEITNQTLIDQLNFIANLYGGTNKIMLVGTGAQGEIGVEYTLTYEKEQTIIPETTVRLTLTDGGVINTCECRQNVQLTMRETVQ